MPDIECFTIEFSSQTNSVPVHVIDIEFLDDKLKGLLDKYLVEICEGPFEINTKLSTSKNELKEFFAGKIEETSKIGPIAEFFIHLYLKVCGYKQQCLFLNLEDKSLKKGFDGYYIYEDETWIMESKAGLHTTQDISHKEKIKEAYKDLNNKISGTVSNNPWRNAYNHAMRVQSSRNILDTLKEFSNNFIDGNRQHNIQDFNLIPCSTIFYKGNWQPEDREETIKAVTAYAIEFNFKNITLICINKNAVDSFTNYLEE